MSEFRFDSFKSLKTPEAWVEKAINIPNSKNKPLPFLRPALFGSAAAAVVVIAVALTLRLHIGDPKLSPKPADVVSPPPVTVAADSTAPAESAYTALPDDSTAPAFSAEAPTHFSEAGTDETAPADSAQPTAPDVSESMTSADAQTEPSSNAGATQPQTEVPSGATAPSKPVQPATELLTVATEAPATGYEEVAIDTVAPTEGVEATVPAELFTESLILRISDSSPLFESTYVRLDIYDSSGARCGGTLILKPRLSNSGYKTVMIKPTDLGMTLYKWQTYTVRASDTGGSSICASVSLHGGVGVYVYF